MRVILKLFNNIVNCSGIILNIGGNHLKQKARNFSVTFSQFKTNPDWGSKKAHRNIKIQQLLLQEMSDPKIEEILAPLRAAVKEQVSKVTIFISRQLDDANDFYHAY